MSVLRCVVIAALSCLAGADSKAESPGEVFGRQLLQTNPIINRIHDGVSVAESRGGGLGTILALAPFLKLALVAVFAMVLATAVSIYIHSEGAMWSGRGDGPDRWEVKHSVWMEQLQKDLDDAWDQS